MRPTRFEEIVFIDDFFRSSDNLLASHPSNRRFLRRAFGLPAKRLRIPCREMFPRSEGGTLDVAGMMRVLALSPSPAGWAKTCIADLSPLLDSGLLPKFSPETLVIGWGMPPSLMHLLDQQSVSFLDIEISPVRFATHLAFCARTNDRQIEAALSHWRIDEEALWNEATVLQGYFSRRGAAHLFNRDLSVGLFCGQTAIDLALVQKGEIARPIDAIGEIEALAARVDLLVIKPHPYEPDLRHLTALADRIPNVAWTDANIYALLCADNLRFVCGLSSGALREARYFMKETIHLITPDRNDRRALPASCSDWMQVGPGIASLEALASFCAKQPETAMPTSSFPEDALDRAFGARWGLDAQNPGLQDLPWLDVGRDHAFRDGSLPLGWFSFGWSEPGPTGVSLKGTLACIVVPLRAGAWPEMAMPTVRINGKPYRAGKSGFRLSAHLDDPKNPRVLVLKIEHTERSEFFLRQLSVTPDSQVAHLSTRPNASSALAVVTALVCMLWVATHFATNTEVAQAVSSDASNWTLIRHVIGNRVDAMRGDIHLILHQHHV
jgi:hypothetical protein